ncbi:hypothetical protein CALCODRAFT_511484 [Calocera cornea HHB12733]|uniref:Uncharacterized protein n=1 Tax=Calocera cornea HHB12733 TaxID=1353952 RepID=A0A165DQW0_9BASI|nr:hypothetical protein CALCODRAFT_511484 [Calocera cornea HHB12733]
MAASINDQSISDSVVGMVMYNMSAAVLLDLEDWLMIGWLSTDAKLEPVSANRGTAATRSVSLLALSPRTGPLPVTSTALPKRKIDSLKYDEEDNLPLYTCHKVLPVVATSLAPEPVYHCYSDETWSLFISEGGIVGGTFYNHTSGQTHTIRPYGPNKDPLLYLPDSPPLILRRSGCLVEVVIGYELAHRKTDRVERAHDKFATFLIKISPEMASGRLLSDVSSRPIAYNGMLVVFGSKQGVTYPHIWHEGRRCEIALKLPVMQGSFTATFDQSNRTLVLVSDDSHLFYIFSVDDIEEAASLPSPQPARLPRYTAATQTGLIPHSTKVFNIAGLTTVFVVREGQEIVFYHAPSPDTLTPYAYAHLNLNHYITDVAIAPNGRFAMILGHDSTGNKPSWISIGALPLPPPHASSFLGKLVYLRPILQGDAAEDGFRNFDSLMIAASPNTRGFKVTAGIRQSYVWRDIHFQPADSNSPTPAVTLTLSISIPAEFCKGRQNIRAIKRLVYSRDIASRPRVVIRLRGVQSLPSLHKWVTGKKLKIVSKEIFHRNMGPAVILRTGFGVHGNLEFHARLSYGFTDSYIVSSAISNGCRYFLLNISKEYEETLDAQYMGQAFNHGRSEDAQAASDS